MFALETHVALSLIIPLVGALGIAITSSVPNIRETVTLVTSVLLCLNVFSILPSIMNGVGTAGHMSPHTHTHTFIGSTRFTKQMGLLVLRPQCGTWGYWRHCTPV